MNLLSDIITYVRRIVKTPSDVVISDALIIDYINRFWINDIDARIQLFDFKKTYQFQTTPGVDKYNTPLYSIQTTPGSQSVGMYPVYQGFLDPVYINGVRASFQTQKDVFYASWPNWVQNLIIGQGDGTAGPYNLQVPIVGTSATNNPPINGLLRGHVDITGIAATGINEDPPVATTINTSIPLTSISPAFYLTYQDATGKNIVISDSGQFLLGNINYGLLLKQGNAPFGYSSLGTYSATQNTVNYLTGAINNITFPASVPSGANIYCQCYYFQSGLPRSVLFYDNVITLRSPPDRSYLVELTGYLSPAAFLSSQQALVFGYMCEYIARGAARKILSDTGDVEQFQFYEPLFREQEMLVWKRAQRQFTSTRTETIYSRGKNSGYNYFGGGAY